MWLTLLTHSSILAWEIPWTEEPGGVQSMGLQEPDMTEWLNPQPPPVQYSNIGYNLSKQSLIVGHLGYFKIFVNTKSAIEIMLVFFFNAAQFIFLVHLALAWRCQVVGIPSNPQPPRKSITKYLLFRVPDPLPQILPASDSSWDTHN